MATIKISNLNQIAPLNPNTGNVSFVATDTQSGISGRITATTLANGLFANNVLNVGNTQISFPNVVAQFAKAGESYIQVNLLNTANGGSADYVATAESGTDTTYFIDTGYANKNFVPGSEYNSLGDAIHALDGYLYVQGNSSAVNVGGNLVIGTTTTDSHVRLIVGGGTSENVVAELGQTYIGINRTLVFGDGTTQNTSFAGAAVSANTPSHVANSAALYANGAFIQANAAFTQSNNNVGINATQNTNIGLAWNKANTALQNTTGVFGGTLTVSGDQHIIGHLYQNNYLSIANTTSSNSLGMLDINASGVNNPNLLPAQVLLRITSSANNASRIVLESYNISVGSTVAARHARGTVLSPTATSNNDVMLRIACNGYTGTQFPTIGSSRIDFVSTENHTDIARGSKIEFWNTETGSNTLTKIASFNAEKVTFIGTVEPQKGFIYTPNVSGTTTAKTIDFSRDSLLKFDVNDNATLSLSNYIAGKVVDVWITNSAAQNKTITHGCLANNSTSKLTTFTILSNSCAFLKYFSIGTDQANTFVSITA